MAADEAKKYGKVHCVASTKPFNDIYLPPQDDWCFADESDYFYYTSNETLTGFSLANISIELPIPVIVDMSSDLLSRRLSFASHQLIFATTAKVFGISGATLVMVEKSFLNTVSKLFFDSSSKVLF